jgi:hypothetical protein
MVSNQNACPSSTSFNFTYNAGPLAAGSVGNLHAMVSVAPGASRSYTVNVISGGATILSCTIAESDTGCSNINSAAVAAGGFVQVQITGVGNPSARPWKVWLSFGE